jgi:Na+/H+-translocating membrane pyrophosphatase
MGADLFGSFAEATCACLVIGSQNEDLRNAGWSAIMFPLIVSCVGQLVCFFSSFLATHIYPVESEHRIELALRLQLVLTTFAMVPAMLVAIQWLPETFRIDGIAKSFEVDRYDGKCALLLSVLIN